MNHEGDAFATSFPGSLVLPPPGASEEIAPGGGKMRDPGNEVDTFEVHFLMKTKHVSHEASLIFSCKIRNAIKYWYYQKFIF